MTGYEQYEVVGKAGQRYSVDCAATLGEMAVTRAALGNGWRLTHLGTGGALPFRFPSAVAAEAAMAELDKIVIWGGVVATAANCEIPNSADEIKRICRAHGGEHTGRRDRRADSAELKRRLENISAEKATP